MVEYTYFPSLVPRLLFSRSILLIGHWDWDFQRGFNLSIRKRSMWEGLVRPQIYTILCMYVQDCWDIMGLARIRIDKRLCSDTHV